MRIEYLIKRMRMPSDWKDTRNLNRKWTGLATSHVKIMNELGKDGWEYFLNIGPLFYFKREVWG